MSAKWLELKQELNVWEDASCNLPIWWRDDDAVEATAKLDAMSERAAQFGLPVHLAVIPKHATSGLARRIVTDEVLRAVVHGWAHVSHAAEGEKNSEFGTERLGAAEDAKQGLVRLRALFGPEILPVFVPPWNRIHPTIALSLPALGYQFISTFTPRPQIFAAPGLEQINTHIDPVDWRGTRSLGDQDLILATLIDNLQARRLGQADASEPLGLLTHHLMQDEATWAFCEKLTDVLLSGPARPVEPFRTR